MKNVNTIQTICKCDKCSQCGFFNKRFYCPLCDSKLMLLDLGNIEIDLDSGDIPFNFCPACNIMIEYGGCIHSYGNGNIIYNAHVISKYEYKNNVYNGMPQFDNYEDCVKHRHIDDDINILEMVCLNNGHHCTKSCYPIGYNCGIAKVEAQSPPPTTFTFDP